MEARKPTQQEVEAWSSDELDQLVSYFGYGSGRFNFNDPDSIHRTLNSAVTVDQWTQGLAEVLGEMYSAGVVSKCEIDAVVERSHALKEAIGNIDCFNSTVTVSPEQSQLNDWIVARLEAEIAAKREQVSKLEDAEDYDANAVDELNVKAHMLEWKIPKNFMVAMVGNFKYNAHKLPTTDQLAQEKAQRVAEKVADRWEQAKRGGPINTRCSAVPEGPEDKEAEDEDSKVAARDTAAEKPTYGDGVDSSTFMPRPSHRGGSGGGAQPKIPRA